MNNDALATALAAHPLLAGARIVRLERLGGGASKEAWALDVEREGRREALFLRRMGRGVLHAHTLTLQAEYAVIAAAARQNVPVPEVAGWLDVVDGREAFLMQRVEAEGLGRRIVAHDRFAAARQRLPVQMANALAHIHAIPASAVPQLPASAHEPAAQRLLAQLRAKLDEAAEPHPVLQLALHRLRLAIADSGADRPHEEVLVHGDFRIGNLLVDEEGLVAVIDWEFAHWGHPAEDLAWPLVRAWRFGAGGDRLGGVGPVEPFLDAYRAATGRGIRPTQLAWWELAGNVRWAVSCLTQARRHLTGQEPSVELAVLGRLTCQPEQEVLHLLSNDEEGIHAGSA